MSQPSAQATSTQQAVPAPPLASFDPTGAASIISYQTPESTSYEGRHVLEISDYVLSDFADVVTATAHASASAPTEAGSSTGTPAAPASNLASGVTAPRAVVLSDSTVPQNKLISLAPYDLSDRLAALTWADVQTAVGAQKRIEVYRSIGGLLDFRVRDISQIRAPVVPQAGASNLRIALARGNQTLRNGGGDGGGVGPHMYIVLGITSPDASNPALSGPAGGLNLPVSGTVESTAGPVNMTVYLLAADKTVAHEVAATITRGSWTATLPVTSSGTWYVRAAASAVAFPTITGVISIQIYVTLAATGGGGPATTPSVAIASPAPNAVIVVPASAAGGSAAYGSAIVQVTGSADNKGGSALTVSISGDGGPAADVQLTPAGGTTFSFTTSVLLTGEGTHSITATAVNQDGVAAPAITVPVTLAATLPVRPLDRRLVLIERIAITSFLGNFGAGRLVKTFSLLPGEETVISVDTYTKDETTAKSASSILDSTATECGADFEDTVNGENDTKAASSDATSASISADVGASWGWGHADIKAGYTDSANSSRENMTKTVTGALAKHTSKASSNRTVSVNTDFSQTVSTGNTTDTTRTLRNINVSRVLNFVFRQMTQEHIVFVHLTDAALGYYALDVLLDANGNPQTGPDGGPLTRETFTEYSLPEIAEFARTQMTGNAIQTLQNDILTVLSSIPDYTGTQQSLVELVTPKAPDGKPQPNAAYLRVRPNLTGTYPATGTAQYTVPGIILGTTTSILRTDQLLCDALLGEGDALDTYSHALQEVAIAERRADAAEREADVAREKLAQSIVSSKDADMAATWQKIFPQPLSVPATVTVPATPDGSAATDAAATGS